MSSACSIRFGGEEFHLLAEGALYWPEKGLLAVSDLHLEKATYLAGQGSFIAPYDTLDTLNRLDTLVQTHKPRELLLLGDSFHDHHAWQRLEVILDVGLSARLDFLLGDHLDRRADFCGLRRRAIGRVDHDAFKGNRVLRVRG